MAKTIINAMLFTINLTLLPFSFIRWYSNSVFDLLTKTNVTLATIKVIKEKLLAYSDDIPKSII